METILKNLANWRTTAIGVLVFVIGVLPEIGNLATALVALLGGDIFALGSVKVALLALITAFGMFFAKDATTGSSPV